MKSRKMKTLLCSAMTAGLVMGSMVNATAVMAEEMKVPDEITVYTYYADASVPVVDGTVENPKEIYPDLKINIEHRTDSDGAVLKTRAAVGELPDIFECTGQLTDILRKSGDLAELDDVIEEKGLADNDIIPLALFAQQKWPGLQMDDMAVVGQG